ncbi:hypothetical protein KKC13_00810 [bacterium]|nr:hypothetical protein [bacterium]MBU1959224.1 hypothetical protein [bacterium]
MSKATKLRANAKNKKNIDLTDLIKEKLTTKPQKVTKVESTTLTNGQKGVTITFDPFN